MLNPEGAKSNIWYFQVWGACDILPSFPCGSFGDWLLQEANPVGACTGLLLLHSYWLNREQGIGQKWSLCNWGWSTLSFIYVHRGGQIALPPYVLAVVLLLLQPGALYAWTFTVIFACLTFPSWKTVTGSGYLFVIKPGKDWGSTCQTRMSIWICPWSLICQNKREIPVPISQYVIIRRLQVLELVLCNIVIEQCKYFRGSTL